MKLMQAGFACNQSTQDFWFNKSDLSSKIISEKEFQRKRRRGFANTSLCLERLPQTCEIVTSSSACLWDRFRAMKPRLKASLHYPSTVIEIPFAAPIENLSGRSPGKVNNMELRSLVIALIAFTIRMFDFEKRAGTIERFRVDTPRKMWDFPRKNFGNRQIPL
jgi:hypothetical protein